LPSIFRKRRKHLEGWALDIEETQGGSLRERLAGNNMLWVVVLLVVVLGTLYYTMHFGKSYSKDPISTVRLGGVAKGEYDDQAHRELADKLTEIAQRRGPTITARFVDASKFEITVPADTPSDEISFLSKFSATAIYRKFGNVPVVYVYSKSAPRSEEKAKLAAITRWIEGEKNFVTKFQRAYNVEETE
jgi:hypothetical protein